MQMLATTELMKEIVVAMTATTGAVGPLNACHVGLFTNTVGIGQGTVMGDLTEPTYPGYARAAVDPAMWEPPSVLSDGTVRSMNCACIHFKMTDATMPTVVTGVFLTDAVAPGGKLLAAGNLDQPYSLLNPDQSLDVMVVVSLPPNLNVGSPLIYG